MFIRISASVSEAPLLTAISRVKDPETSATKAPSSTDIQVQHLGTRPSLVDNAAMLNVRPASTPGGGKPSGPDTILFIAIGTLAGAIALCVLCIILGSIWFQLKGIREQKRSREMLEERQMANPTRARVPIMDYGHHPDYLLTRKLNLSALSRSISFPSLGNEESSLYATPRRSIAWCSQNQWPMRYPRPSSRVQPLPTLLEGDSPHSLRLTPSILSRENSRSSSLHPEAAIGDHASESFSSSPPSEALSNIQQQPPRSLDASSLYTLGTFESPLLTVSDFRTCTTMTLAESSSSLPGYFKIGLSEPRCSEITALKSLSDYENADVSVKNIIFSSVASKASGEHDILTR